MESRKNAMLTTEDRRWLTGAKEYSGEHAKQQRYQRRRDIRERVYNSMLDFSILFSHLDERERERIFGAVTTGGTRWNSPDEELEDGVRDCLAFVTRTVGVAGLVNGSFRAGSNATVPERVLTDALVRVGAKEGLLVEDVRLEIDAADATPEEALARLESGETVSTAELHALLESELLDPTAVQECLRTMLAARGPPTE